MHDYDDEQSEAECLKKSTSDKIHAATHHWHWVDTIVHVLHVLIIIVASRMKLMDVANLRERAREKRLRISIYSEKLSRNCISKKLIKNS